MSRPLTRRLHPSLAWALLAALSLAPLVGCASSDLAAVEAPGNPAGDATSSTPLVPIRNARVPLEGLLSGGQPTQEQIEMAAHSGYRTVINLRTEGESGYEWEQETVERLGMRYVHIPIAGGDTMTPEAIGRIDAALDEALAEGPVLFHCASGNRIGAVLALRAAWEECAEPDDAVAFGVSSGMTRLSETVREILDESAVRCTN